MDRTNDDLKQLQALPLYLKVAMTKARVREWVNHYGQSGCYISFSGGKDSTVLRHIVNSEYPDIPSVFVNTGLEYPEIQQFVRRCENVVIIRPEMRFDEVIKTYGYPVVSKEISQVIEEARRNATTGKYTYRLKRLNGELLDKKGNKSRFNCENWKFLLDAPFKISNKCCDVMKKKPVKKYEKETERVAIVGTMAEESRVRKQAWLKTGCNAFESKRPMSKPMSFWTEQDVLQYIVENKLEYASVYGDIFKDLAGKYYTTGAKRTGCMFCMFGVQCEKSPNRFEMMKQTHSKQYDYCINKLGCGKVLDYIGVKYDGEYEETHQLSIYDVEREIEKNG